MFNCPICGSAQPVCSEAHDLRRKNLWGEHPEHPRDDWRLDVYEGNTNLGYWEWVSARLDEGED